MEGRGMERLTLENVTSRLRRYKANLKYLEEFNL
jgi:hypothetical protein